MPEMLENAIVDAIPDPATGSVTLTWANGAITVSSFHHLVGIGVFAAFADPAFFAKAQVGPRGRSLDLPDGIDFCADALWFEAQPADSPDHARQGAWAEG
jgi:hypothetical protein